MSEPQSSLDPWFNDAVQKIRDCFAERDQLKTQLAQALSTTAGQDLIDKLERYEKALSQIANEANPSGKAGLASRMVAREALKEAKS